MSHVFSLRKFPDYKALSQEAAAFIFEKIRTGLSEKNHFVLGCATGSTPLGVYQHLLKLLRESPLDFSNFYTVNLDEYYPIKRSDIHSYYQWMQENFWQPLQSINPTFNIEKQTEIPDGDAADPQKEAERYEEKIRSLGGVDLQILGIGRNGHIGFNEPGSSADSRTRLVKLSEATRQDNSRFFNGDVNEMPKQALTMGIGTILEAKKITVIVSGQNKADIVKRIMEMKEPTPDIPATVLKRHPGVTYFLDTEAASLL